MPTIHEPTQAMMMIHYEDEHSPFHVVLREQFEGELTVNNWWLKHGIIVGPQG